MKKERAQIEKFIHESVNSPRFYVSSGEIEPVQMKKAETVILTKNLKALLKASTSEVINSQKAFKKQTKRRSNVLIEQQEQIEKIEADFMMRINDTPWVFQKCSLRSLIMIMRCLSCIQEDSTRLC